MFSVSESDIECNVVVGSGCGMSASDSLLVDECRTIVGASVTPLLMDEMAAFVAAFGVVSSTM